MDRYFIAMMRNSKTKHAINVIMSIGLVTACTFMSACNPRSATKQYNMKNEKQTYPKDEAAIRQRVEEYIEAIRAKDLERVMKIFAPGLVSFDLEPPLQHMRAESKRRNWTKAFAAYQAPIGYEVRDLAIILSNDLAVGRSVNRISGTLMNGKKTGYWVRWTTCFQKIEDTWYVTHDHVSVPLDLKSGRGVLNIEP